jgi:hypothetical protein
MASRNLKAYRSITLLCFAVDASDQSVSCFCKRLVRTTHHTSIVDLAIVSIDLDPIMLTNLCLKCVSKGGKNKRESFVNAAESPRGYKTIGGCTLQVWSDWIKTQHTASSESEPPGQTILRHTTL